MSIDISNYVRSQIQGIPANIDNYVSSNGDKFYKRDDFSRIKRRIDDFIDGVSDERFFILPGLRGVGKTTLMLQCYEYLLKKDNININDLLYISCENIRFIENASIMDAVEFFLEEYHHTSPMYLKKPVFIFIDEAHFDNDWALQGKILYDQSKYIFMVMTGSSSLHLDYNADAARRLRIHNILPLNYSQHLKLKYNYQTSISDEIINIIFNGDYHKAQDLEFKIKNDLVNNINYNPNDWDDYLKYGGFPFTFNKSYADVVSGILTSIDKIITHDMGDVYNLTNNSQNIAFKTILYIASQKPGEITQNKLAANMSISKSTVNSICQILERTQLLFHYDVYGSAGKRMKKSWKYYLATSSIKHCINEKYGSIIQDKNDYEGILLENLVASTLFNLSNSNTIPVFNTYYDASSGGVDFIVQRAFEKPIPIEVGIGKKADKQVRKAINKLGSDYGIIISNKTDSIKCDGDIIYIPPKTFSFL